ncbi:unnamed protein product [Effrenium voratum]|nr:unnamed protein product [Effrenium voratum]
MVVVPEGDLVSDCEAGDGGAFTQQLQESHLSLPTPGYSMIGAYNVNMSVVCNRQARKAERASEEDSFHEGSVLFPRFVGTEMLEVPQNLSLYPYTHWAVYTRSSLVEQSTPSSLMIYDMVANVSNITFQGLDLDYAHLGGTVKWLEPALLERVYSYVLYLAESPAGDYRSQVESEVLVGTNELLVPAETLRSSYTHFVVYTKSTLAEQTTPSYLAFLDEVSVAGNVSFVDEDLDRFEIGGDLVWLQPEDDSEVTHYMIYLAEDSSGLSRSLLGNVSRGVHEFSVPADTALEAFTHLTVFARSELVESTTPNSVLVVDVSSSISNLRFTDLDLDQLELGGYATWTGSTIGVVGYRMYLATDASGAGRTQVGSEVPVGGNVQMVPAETALGDFTHLVVYTRSALAEQSTPVAPLGSDRWLPLVDNVAQVTDIIFPDFDLDQGDLGGLLEWTEPIDTSQAGHIAASEACGVVSTVMLEGVLEVRE